MLHRTGSFLSALREAQGIDGVWSALSTFARSFGFDRSMLGATRPGPEGAMPVEYRTDLRPDLFADYVESGRFRADPMFHAAHRLPHPFAIHLDWFRDVPLSPEHREVFESEIVQASALRVVMPVIEAPGGERWSVVLGGPHSARETSALLGEAMPTLWLAASAAGGRLASLSARSPPNPLSLRERECLLWLAKGDRVDRIAERLGLSSATVELHLSRARHRLGARTSAEAVAKAVLQGFIEP